MPEFDSDNGEDRASERRHRLNNEAMVAQRLEDIQRMQREVKRDFEQLRRDVADDAKSGTERGYAIRRIEERVGEVFARLTKVEASYVSKEDHEKAIAPFRKGVAWVATLIIGTVITGLMALLLNKGAIH